jgi:hypothetical protein
VFSISNQGSQSVGVWIEDGGTSNAVEWSGTGSDNNSDFTTSMEGASNAYTIGSGETVYVNVVILLQDNDASSLPDAISVKADASQG